MMTDTEFFNFVQQEALAMGCDGDQIHKQLHHAHTDIATFIYSLGASFMPDEFGVNLYHEDEPYVYADWIDTDSGLVLSLQFFADNARMAVYDSPECEELLLVKRFEERKARMLVYTLSSMPSRYTQ